MRLALKAQYKKNVWNFWKIFRQSRICHLLYWTIDLKSSNIPSKCKCTYQSMPQPKGVSVDHHSKHKIFSSFNRITQKISFIAATPGTNIVVSNLIRNKNKPNRHKLFKWYNEEVALGLDKLYFQKQLWDTIK